MPENTEIPFTVGCANQIAVTAEKFKTIDEKIDLLISRFENLSMGIKEQHNRCDHRFDELEKFQSTVVSIGKVGISVISICVALTAIWRFFYK